MANISPNFAELIASLNDNNIRQPDIQTKCCANGHCSDCKLKYVLDNGAKLSIHYAMRDQNCGYVLVFYKRKSCVVERGESFERIDRLVKYLCEYDELINVLSYIRMLYCE